MTTGLTSEQKAQLLQRLADEMFSRGNMGIADEITTEDMIYESPTVYCSGREECKRYIATLRTVWSGLIVDVRDVRVEGNEVSAGMTFSGLHVRDFLGVPASNKPFAVSGNVVAELNGNRICRVDVTYLINDFFRQVDGD
ncbi:ester cyclase [candidate division KSB1 bacterium]|nr:ester cyclase [candidate division KSB1 bacterium]